MVDRNQRARGMDSLQQCVPGRDRGASDAKVEKIGGAKDVRVALKSGQFASWNQQDIIKIRLQFPHGMVLGHRVVVGDGDEIKPSLRGRLNGEK